MSKNAKEHLLQDPYLKKVIDSTKLEPLTKDRTVYTTLTGSIVSQQLSVKAADTIHKRFLGLFENLHPDPHEIIKMDIETLRSAGLSRQKASYIQHVADFFLNEKLLGKDWSKIPDDDIIEYLTQIKGVGKWTVQMILMFTLNRPDVFPVNDLGIQNAIIQLYELEEKYSRDRASQKALREHLYLISENWRPYRTTACRYLWKYLHQ